MYASPSNREVQAAVQDVQKRLFIKNPFLESLRAGSDRLINPMQVHLKVSPLVFTGAYSQETAYRISVCDSPLQTARHSTFHILLLEHKAFWNSQYLRKQFKMEYFLFQTIKNEVKQKKNEFA